MFKKFLILFFVLFSFQSFAIEKKTTFTLEAFNEAQKAGKTIVINSWNKSCFTCKKQTKILDQAEKEFKDILFLSFDKKTNNRNSIKFNSWNKFCGTCARQTKILNEAQKDFPDVIFLSYEQTKHKDIAKLLNVDYWATIIVYKNSKEVAKEIGITSKSDIYSLIKKEI